MMRLRDLLLGKEHREAMDRVSNISDHWEAEDRYNQCEDFVVMHPAAPKSGVHAMMDANVAFDLELFADYDHGTDNCVLTALRRCHTRGGLCYLQSLLSHPLKDVGIWERRKHVLQCVCERRQVDMSATEAQLQTLRHHERDMEWLLKQSPTDPQAVKGLVQLVTFTSRITKIFNRSPACIGTYNLYRRILCPTMHIGCPLLYAVLPFVVLRVFMGIRIGLVPYMRIMWTALNSTSLILGQNSLMRLGSLALSCLMYIQGSLSALDISGMVGHVNRFVTARIVGCMRFCLAAQALLRKYWGEPELPHVWFQQKSLSAAAFCRTLLPSVSMVQSCIGRCIHSFLTIDRTTMRTALSATYMVDCILGIAALRSEPGMCDAHITNRDHQRGVQTTAAASKTLRSTERDEPASGPGTGDVCLRISGVRHPCIPVDLAVGNEVCLGCNSSNSSRGLLITGPNAGGKSTLIKSVAIAALMAQSLTVVAAQSYCATAPFNGIATHLNVPDIKGHKSMFEAQLHHIQGILKHLQPPCLVVADELFNSTNMAEGEAAAFAVAKQLAETPGCLVLITTHYTRLATAFTHLPGLFTAAAMNADLRKDGTVVRFPFKLQLGVVSDQKIALELAKSRGYPPSLLKDAIEFRDAAAATAARAR
jgi:hypothetical protein